MTCKSTLLLGATAFCAFFPVAAQAQVAAPPAPPAQPAAADDGGLQEIVVTANKRAQNLNSVGLTITTIGADELAKQKITSLSDVAALVPGLVYSPSTANTPIFTLRGIGFNEAALGVYPAVSVYQDEAPLPFPVLASHAAYDLERIEVLKGPQGTLFGQNSTGGAINYIAAKPTSEFHAGGDLSYGRFNQVEGNAFITGALTPTLNGRIAVTALHADDWQKNAFRDDKLGEQKYFAGRALLDWQPIDALKVSANVNGWIDKSDPQAQQYAIFQPQKPGTQQVLLDYPFVPTGDPRLADWTGGKYRPRSDRRFWQGVLRADLKVADDITLTSLTSYDWFKQKQVTDGDGMALSSYDLSPNDGHIRSFNQEVRLSNGGTSRFTWVLGGNYERSRVVENQVLYYPVSAVNNSGNNNIFQSGIYTNQKMRNLAAFGNAEYKLTDALTLKAGVRYTDAKRDAFICGYDAGDGRINQLFTAIGAALSGQTVNLGPGSCYSVNYNNVPGAPFIDSLHENNVSWRVGADYTVRPGFLLYANVSRGFKGGSYPTVAAATFTQLAPVTQEKVTAYEGGFKATLADRRLQLNGAAFYYDYRDKQVRGKLLDPIFGLLDVLVNVPKSRIYGAEVEVTARPTDGLTLNGGVTYLNSRVQNYNGYNILGTLQSFSGVDLPFTPKLTYTASAEYRFLDMFAAGTPFIGASVFGRTSQDAVFAGDRLAVNGVNGARVVDGITYPFHIKGYATLDLRAGYESSNGWRVMVFGKNVFDKYYITSVIPGSNTSSRFVGRPATWGVTVGLKI